MHHHHNAGLASRVVFLSAMALALSACGRGDRDTADTATGDAVRPPAATPPPAGSAQITAAMVALGDSIFEGKAAGGICFSCHGADGKGTQLAPDLTDQQWLNGDGSYDFIVQVITNGVAVPKQFPAAMPPFGQSLSPEQARATAAYVYALTHPVGG
jgi:mono/diheme cytochrome c family protein